MDVKIRIIKNVTASIDGQSVRCKEGDVLEISEGDADNLIRGGYAEGTRAAVKVKVKPQGKPLTSKSVKGE